MIIVRSIVFDRMTDGFFDVIEHLSLTLIPRDLFLLQKRSSLGPLQSLRALESYQPVDVVDRFGRLGRQDHILEYLAFLVPQNG